MKIRKKYENKGMGDFERIYPLPKHQSDQAKEYTSYLKYAHLVYTHRTGTRSREYQYSIPLSPFNLNAEKENQKYFYGIRHDMVNMNVKSNLKHNNKLRQSLSEKAANLYRYYQRRIPFARSFKSKFSQLEEKKEKELENWNMSQILTILCK